MAIVITRGAMQMCNGTTDNEQLITPNDVLMTGPLITIEWTSHRDTVHAVRPLCSALQWPIDQMANYHEQTQHNKSVANHTNTGHFAGQPFPVKHTHSQSPSTVSLL